jgi:hypothetical protein
VRRNIMTNIYDASKLLLLGLAMPLVLTGCPSETDGDDEVGDTATDTTGDTTADDTTTTTSTTTVDDTTTDDTTTDDTTTDTTTGEDPFVFAADPPESYTRVDRMGMPAVATAVITSKDMYNAANPSNDANLDFVAEIGANVGALHVALDDDLMGFMLEPCLPNDCLAQAGPAVIPDTLKIDLTAPAGFPNGRALTDQVIDITLALVLLDLTAPMQGVTTFSDIPLNPGANDAVFLDDFPYLAPPVP